MRILYCITGLGIGGAEAVTIDIANRMVGMGHQVSFMYLAGENKQTVRMGEKIKTVGLGMVKTPWGFAKAQWKARRFIQEWKPDVVHANMVHANLFCRFLRLSCKIPLLICTEHTTNIEGRGRMLMYRVTDFLSDVNTNVSESSTQSFIRSKLFSTCKSFTVYNGVDVDKFLKCEKSHSTMREKYNIPDKMFLFLNVGRLMPAKDQKNLITAFKNLSDDCSNVGLMLVGDGDLRKELEDHITKLALKERVWLVGTQTNVADYYHMADCFILSSAWEGFPIALIEAMASNLPVIATDVGGCREAVYCQEFIVEPRNPVALCMKMRQVHEMGERERQLLGKKNRERAILFDIDTICGQWLKIYGNKDRLN